MAKQTWPVVNETLLDSGWTWLLMILVVCGWGTVVVLFGLLQGWW
jgi:hypothetical protein